MAGLDRLPVTHRKIEGGMAPRRHLCESCWTVFTCPECTAIMHYSLNRNRKSKLADFGNTSLYAIEHEPRGGPQSKKRAKWLCPECQEKAK